MQNGCSAHSFGREQLSVWPTFAANMLNVRQEWDEESVNMLSVFVNRALSWKICKRKLTPNGFSLDFFFFLQKSCLYERIEPFSKAVSYQTQIRIEQTNNFHFSRYPVEKDDIFFKSPYNPLSFHSTKNGNIPWCKTKAMHCTQCHTLFDGYRRIKSFRNRNQVFRHSSKTNSVP